MHRPPPLNTTDAVDGFVLHNMNVVDDGGLSSEQYSAPSMLSPLSGFSSGASSSALLRNNPGSAGGNPGPRLPPPPQTATLRTNFTTNQPANNARRQGENNGHGAAASPDATGFQDISTPAGGYGFGYGLNDQNDAIRPFLDIMAPQEKVEKPSTLNMLAIFAAIVIGLIVGSLIQHFDVNTTVAEWLMTPGNLYLRAVQCVVIPFVFVNMVVSTADLVHMRLGGRIALRVALLFLLVVVLALAQGVGMGFLMRAVFHTDDEQLADATTEAVFGIQCANSLFLELQTNGSVTCSASSVNNAASFIVDDVNSALVRNSDTSDSTLSANLISIISTIVPSNIMSAFVNVTLLSVVAFAIPMGVMVAHSFHGPIHMNPLLEFLREVNETLVHMIQWVMRFTPLAVLSLMVGSFGTNLDNSLTEHPLRLVYKLSGTFAFGVFAHMLVVMPVLFAVFTRGNPFAFMRHLAPAYVLALGCSSSSATLPMSLRCLQESRVVSNSVLYFVMALGSNLCMAGTAMYLPMMVYFMVDLTGLSPDFGGVDMLVLLIGSLLGAISAAPIPSGALTIITTVWGVVLPKYSIPASVSALLLAADVILDRLVTLANVNSAAMTCRIVSHHADGVITEQVMRAQRERRQQPYSISEM